MDALVERLTRDESRKDLTLHRTQAPDGTVTEQWQIDDEKDVRLYRKAQGWTASAKVASIGMLPPELIEQRRPAASFVDEVITLGKARDGWLATLKATTLPKTYTTKKRPLISLSNSWADALGREIDSCEKLLYRVTAVNASIIWNMSDEKGEVMTGVGILAIIAVAVVQYAGTQSLDGVKLENDGAVERETKDESKYKVTSESLTNRKADSFVYDTKGVSARYASSPDRAYHYISKCYARKSFENFFKSSQGDPTSIFNDKAKLEAISDVKRSYLESDLNMMASAKKECAEWDSNVDKDTASQQVYGSALNAAIAGEDDATACLIFNSWKLPEKTSRQFIELQDSFKNSAAELIQRGIKNGNWKVVAANVMAFRERNGLGAVVPGNNATGYYFARLAQLGSSNNELSSSYGYDASNFANNSSRDDIERADQKAKQDFESFFVGSKLSEEDITVRCGK